MTDPPASAEAPAPNDASARRIAPHLREGEVLLAACTTVIVAGGSGVRGPAGPTAVGVAIGNRLGRLGAVTGGAGSLAASIPGGVTGPVLGITDARVGLWGGLTSGHDGELWSVPRAQVVGVERRPRLQLLARYRLHFTDGSSAALMTARQRTVRQLQGLLGTAGG